jgi:hypothetical protein
MPPKRDARYGWVILAALLGAAVLGCSRHSPSTTLTPNDTRAPPFAQSSSEEFESKDDPCTVLEPKEVEAVLGAPLAAPPYRSANGTVDPTPTGDSCIYETAKFRYVSLDVTFTGGAQAYSMSGMVKNLMKSSGNAQIANNVKKNFKLDDGTEMSGEWDEASLVAMNCCIFQALRGDQLITLDFTASPATLRQAATLVDSAYKRIDHPLKINGGAGVTAAKALDKTRPKPVTVCSLLTRAEVEAILGPLKADPAASGQSGCQYDLPDKEGYPPSQVDVQIDWRGGYAGWRSDHHVGSLGMGAVNQLVTDWRGGHQLPGMQTGSEDASAAAGEAKPAEGGDPAEAVAHSGMGGYTAVKRDVQVKVRGAQMVDPARQRALVAAFMRKI